MDKTRNRVVLPPGCPQCLSREGYRPLKLEKQPGAGLFLLLTGGLLAYWLHSDQTENKVVCRACGYAFSPKRAVQVGRPGTVALVFVLLGAALLLVAILVNAS